MATTNPGWVDFERICVQFYEHLGYTVRGVSDKAVRAVLKIPGWQINLARRPEHHVIADQHEWRTQGARIAQRTADFLVEVSPNHWIIAEAKSGQAPDPRFLSQLQNAVHFAKQKRPNVILELHLLVPAAVDGEHLFTLNGAQYRVEAPFRALGSAQTGRLLGPTGVHRILGMPILVVMI